MISKTLFIILLSTLVIGCQQKKDTTFLITQDSVGNLKKNSTVQELSTLFVNDSIVKDTTKLLFGTGIMKIKVYEKGGKHLLTLTPSTDSIALIENIQINDARYITEEGIHLTSTFKDIGDAYTIRKVVSSMNNVVLFLKDSDVYFTISKEELPASLRYTSSTNIEAVQIPENAKIKFMMVGWD